MSKETLDRARCSLARCSEVAEWGMQDPQEAPDSLMSLQFACTAHVGLVLHDDFRCAFGRRYVVWRLPAANLQDVVDRVEDAFAKSPALQAALRAGILSLPSERYSKEIKETPELPQATVAEPTKERLAKALEAEGLHKLAERARAGQFDDYESESPTPCVDLVAALQGHGHHDLAKRASAGEFDATAAEADAWARKQTGSVKKIIDVLDGLTDD